MKQNILDECLPNEEMDWNGHPWNMLFHANTIHIIGSILKKCSWWRCPIIKELTLSGRDSSFKALIFNKLIFPYKNVEYDGDGAVQHNYSWFKLYIFSFSFFKGLSFLNYFRSFCKYSHWNFWNISSSTHLYLRYLTICCCHNLFPDFSFSFKIWDPSLSLFSWIDCWNLGISEIIFAFEFERPFDCLLCSVRYESCGLVIFNAHRV